MTAKTITAPRRHLWTLLLLSASALGLLPWVAGGYAARVVINACRYLVLALSFDIVSGYTGYMNLGHAAFFGIGGYTFGILVNGGVPASLASVAAVLLTVSVAGLISYPFFACAAHTMPWRRSVS